VRPPSDDVSSESVIAYVNSLLGRAFFEDASKQTTNLASINMAQLRSCPFPLPTPHRRQDPCPDGAVRPAGGSLSTAADTRRCLDALLAEALAPIEDRELEAEE
jgi:type I restriction enzyme S subunit